MSSEPKAEYMSIAAAAKAIGMSRARLRRICVAAGVAVQWGEGPSVRKVKGVTKECGPYLKVKLSEALRAVDRQRYVPPRPQKRVAGRRLVAVGNPDVTC